MGDVVADFTAAYHAGDVNAMSTVFADMTVEQMVNYRPYLLKQLID